MTETIWSDISEFQAPVNDSYSSRILSFRANDGTYRDAHYELNSQWAKAKANAGALDAFIVYTVWEPDWRSTFATFQGVVGQPHPKMAVMIDVESWQGRIQGDNSSGINAYRQNLISWIGGDPKRVFGYGNRYDLASLWPNRGDANLIVASYTDPISFPNMIAQQFSMTYYVPTFGRCDANRANMTSTDFAATIGIGGENTDNHNAHPITPPAGDEDAMYIIVKEANSSAIALCGTGVWQPLTYGPNPCSSDDIKVLLGLPLCKSKTIVEVSSARYALLKHKIAGQ